MTKEEAFEILTQATGAINANREIHVKINQALEVVKSELFKKQESV